MLCDFLSYIVGDRWRIMLIGDIQDYIHAVAVNVWKFFIVELLLPLVRLTNFIPNSGLQTAESFHHSSKSHAIHCQGFLEDDS